MWSLVGSRAARWLGGGVGRVLVLVGSGRYADPWHDAAAQADEVAQVARALGNDVRVRSTRPTTFDELGGWLAPGPALLVVAASGDPRHPLAGTDAEWRAFHDARQGVIDAGASVLALHQAAYAFRDDPRWAATIGGRWIEGHSWHPPFGPTTVRTVDDEHPVTWDVHTMTTDDERYADLVIEGSVHTLVVADISPDEAGTHGTPGAHPVVWTLPGRSGGRVLYDALGHDARSFAAPSRRALLSAEISWLLTR